MRMLKIAALMACFAAPAGAQETKVDFAKLNSLFAQIVSDVMALDEDVTDLGLSFDLDQTDLEKDTLKFDLEVALASAPWNQQPFAALASVDFKASPIAGLMDMNSVVSLSLKTDSIDLFRFGAKIFYKKWCASGTSDFGYDPSLAEKVCDQVEILENADSLTTLVEVETRVHQLFVEYEEAKIVEYQEALAQASLDYEKNDIKNQIKSSQEDLEELKSLVLYVKKDSASGQVESFKLALEKPYNTSYLDVGGLSLDVASQSTALSITLHSRHETADLFYKTYKPEVVAYLKNLETTDQEGREGIAVLLKGYITLIKELASEISGG